ncbi:hypothetical protein ACOME3_009031 [Neoechinorhynchus agilis]
MADVVIRDVPQDEREALESLSREALVESLTKKASVLPPAEKKLLAGVKGISVAALKLMIVNIDKKLAKMGLLTPELRNTEEELLEATMEAGETPAFQPGVSSAVETDPQAPQTDKKLAKMGLLTPELRKTEEELLEATMEAGETPGFQPGVSSAVETDPQAPQTGQNKAKPRETHQSN